MNLLRTAATLIVIGTLYAENGVAGETTSPKSAAYLQLAFVQSVADCKAEEQAWIKAHSSRDMATQCFLNASPPSDRRRLPSYLFQVASTKSELQPTTASQTFTYRALGPIKLAKDQEGANPMPPGDGEVKFYQMMVFSNPTTPAQDAAFNDWYDHQHVPEVIRNAGFISGQRFVQLDDGKGKELQLPRYLVIFTLKSGDLKATNSEISARIRDGRTKMSPAFGTDSGTGLFATPVD